ncbi:hypothetical protein Tco_0660093 [Tanacetum coccineum]
MTSCLNNWHDSLGLIGKVKNSAVLINMRDGIGELKASMTLIYGIWEEEIFGERKETMGWIPDFDEQEEDNSESEDEQSVGFIKEDFDGSDVEKEGDNNVSMVPDSLYSLLNKKRNVEEKMDKSNETVSIPFPPGFTPCDETEVECDKKSMGNNEGSGFCQRQRGESVLLVQGKQQVKKLKDGGEDKSVLKMILVSLKVQGLNPKAKRLGLRRIWFFIRSAKKMSKLDRFLMSEGLLGVNPNFSALTLDRLTLLKAVFGSMPIYHMSIFKVPMLVLQRMESIRCHFFNGNDLDSKRSIWVSWNKVLTSKEKGGLGVSSLFALNRALMFKWVWRFFNQSDSLWVRVIHAIHGVDGRIGRAGNVGYTSIWCDIIKEMDRLASHGIDLISMMHKKIGNGSNTSFWKDRWRGEQRLKEVFPRIYALEVNKHISVAFKFEQTSLASSLRRMPRSGIESEQWDHLLDSLEGVMLSPSEDRWSWDLNGSGEFSVASARRYIDNNRLPDISSKTRWIKEVPIKVNVHAWKVRINGLPTRWNISRRY